MEKLQSVLLFCGQTKFKRNFEERGGTSNNELKDFAICLLMFGYLLLSTGKFEMLFIRQISTNNIIQNVISHVTLLLE